MSQWLRSHLTHAKVMGYLDGTAFATESGMDVVKKFTVDGVMGILGNPFMPYIALLFALLRSL